MTEISSTKPASGSTASLSTPTRPSIPPVAADAKAANGRKPSPPPTPSAQAKEDQTAVTKETPSKDNAKEATDAKNNPTAASSAPAIDMETFKQILELDEDDTYDFSQGMAWAYFSQVQTTFEEMDEALEKKDLGKLSSLGHFLKGSSAALGVSKVQLSCTKIQHYGVLRDEDTSKDLDEKEALDMISDLLAQVKVEYQAAEDWLKNWYKERGIEGDPE